LKQADNRIIGKTNFAFQEIN